MDVPILAGMVAAMVFAISNLPMLRKALRTRDVSSYSLPSIVMINGANAVYSIYVFSLPPGPIWALHAFYLVACGIMLTLCVRGRRSHTDGNRTDAIPAGSADDPEPRFAADRELLDAELAHGRTGRAEGEPVE